MRSLSCIVHWTVAVLLALLLTHVLIVFYASTFEWADLKSFFRPTPYSEQTKHKAAFYFVCILASILGHVSSTEGCVLICLCAIPQLYRSKGGQSVRVILGPLTLILSINNCIVDTNPLTLTGGFLSVLAFGVFRPDNTSVARLVRLHWIDAKFRRRLHGLLASANAAVSLISVVEEARLHLGWNKDLWF